ncbi:MAG TPA: cyclic pyranopterin monophosphate synthase MoaC [Candidatus Angelobacter sp.]|nr:cyclic pyranopterin monophosphate synthase MoaC [Candidatus Angelobacter sp.]
MKDAKPGSAKLTHVGPTGEARMVDISGKPVTNREARARGSVKMSPAALDAIVRGNLPKGEVIGTARIAGIQAAKRTSELIPMCHPLALTMVDVLCRPDTALPGIQIESVVRCEARTGAEMEALTAVAVAALTIVDMAKSVDRWMTIGGIELVAKRGGKSGDLRRPA